MNKEELKKVIDLHTSKSVDFFGIWNAVEKYVETIKIEKGKPKKAEDDFLGIVNPVIKYLGENMYPHTKIIVTSVGAELLEGVKSTGIILDHLKD